VLHMPKQLISSIDKHEGTIEDLDGRKEPRWEPMRREAREATLKRLGSEWLLVKAKTGHLGFSTKMSGFACRALTAFWLYEAEKQRRQ